jgi:D-alanyl-D-alanine carboxypeptidase (penicillin-binding protein 5/6)
MKKTKLFLLIYTFLFLVSFVLFPFSCVTATSISTYSPSCILMEKETGKILYEKNAYEVRFPASTTKIMTAILAVENCELTDVAKVSHNAIFSVPVSYSHASLKEDEELTIEQLLNVLLIPSANDAANVLAEHISGSVEEFANLMNEKAKEIGCLNTHFVNPNGVHNKNHTTTAYDLALMGKYAMQFPTIREIVKKTRCSLPTTNKYDKTDRTFNVTNDLLKVNHSNSKSNYYYPDATGIKTGYTTEAGSCIIASAKKNGMEVIVVVLGAGSTKDGLSERYLDCINLFNYAFNNYKMQTLHEKGSVQQQIVISGATENTKNLNVLVKDAISILLPDGADASLTPEIVLNDNLKAPIAANSVIGTITYHVDNESYSSDLLAETNVIASGSFPILVRIVLILVTIYLIYLLLRNPKGKYGKKVSKKKKSKKSKGKKRGNGNFRFTALNNF